MQKFEEIARVREGYARWASSYGEDGSPLTGLELERVQAACGEVRGEAVETPGQAAHGLREPRSTSTGPCSSSSSCERPARERT
jgi:hypothetical protein